MEGTVSSDETSVLANSTKKYIQTDQRTQIHFDTLAPSAKIKKGEKLPSQETLQKMKMKSTKEENVHTNPQQE